MSSSHWNDLAASLGAEIKEEQPAAAPQPAAPPVRAQKKPAERKPTASRPAADWSALAGSLGIEVPAEAAKPVPAAPPNPIREAAAEVAPHPADLGGRGATASQEPGSDESAPARERGDRGERDRGERGEERRRGGRSGRRDRRGRGDRNRRDRGEGEQRGDRPSREFPAAEEFGTELSDQYIQEDSVDMELSVPSDALGDTVIEEQFEAGERSGDDQDGTGRRRRRRRRGGRRSRRSRERDDSVSAKDAGSEQEDDRDDAFAELDLEHDDTPLVPPELDVDPLAGIDTFDDEEVDEVLAEGAATKPRDDESGEQRGRRRRRRRRGRGRKESPETAEIESESESGDSVAGGWGSARSSADARDERGQGRDEDGGSETDEADEELIGANDKNSHRAIPTWDEAIGYIVAVNMDSRTKNPGRSGAPRGGRGRRGGRNGSRGGNRSN